MYIHYIYTSYIYIYTCMRVWLWSYICKIYMHASVQIYMARPCCACTFCDVSKRLLELRFILHTPGRVGEMSWWKSSGFWISKQRTFIPSYSLVMLDWQMGYLCWLRLCRLIYVVNVLTRVGSCHPTIGDRIDIISIKNTRNPTFTNPCGMLLNPVYWYTGTNLNCNAM